MGVRVGVGVGGLRRRMGRNVLLVVEDISAGVGRGDVRISGGVSVVEGGHSR